MESTANFYNTEQMTGQVFLQSLIKTLVPPLRFLLSPTHRSLVTLREFVSISCCEMSQREESAQQEGRSGKTA